MSRQIIGIDLANEQASDNSAVSTVCLKCKSILYTYSVDQDYNEINVKIFIKCPVCGIKFKRHIISEDK